MPPLYDNIVDAYELIADGEEHVVDFTTTGCTMETNESTDFYGFQEVWGKIDFSDPVWAIVYGDSIPVTIKVERLSGTIVPEVDLIEVDDATFDPSSPDFNKVSYGGDYLGDGTATPPQQVWDVDAIFGDVSVNGIFYLWISDWNFTDTTGVLRLTYTLPATPVSYTIDTSDYNLGSGTVTSLGGGVIKETQAGVANYSTDDRGIFDDVYTFRIPTGQMPPNGRYQPYLLGKMNRSSASSSGVFWRWRAAIRRNGELLGPASWLQYLGTQTRPSTVDTWKMFGEPNDFPFTPKHRDGRGPDTIPILSGDTIEIIVSGEFSDSSWFEISGLLLVQVEEGGHSRSVTLATLSRDPDVSDDGLIAGTAVENRVYQKDFCVLDNGDIYVVYRAFNSPPASTPRYERLRMVKWNGSAWSTIASDLSNNQLGSSYTQSYGQLSVDTDGTDVYVAWGEADNTAPGSGTFNGIHAMKWYCKKYTPGSGFTSLGSGNNAVPQGSRTQINATVGPFVPDSADYGPSIMLKIAPNGVPWVAFGETEDAIYGGAQTNTRVYVWYWDGAAWQDTSFPDNPNMTLATSGAYLNYIDVDAQHNIDMTFCHHDGPSNYPSIIYSLGGHDSVRGGSSDIQRFIYREYNGSSWVNLVDQKDSEIWPGGTYAPVTGSPTWTFGSGQQGMAMNDDGERPIFAAALWNNRVGGEPIKIAKMASDGSGFEPYLGTNRLTGVNYFTEYKNGGNYGSWSDPTGCIMAIDRDTGKPWIVTLQTGSYEDEYGLVLATVNEDGTDNHWILGAKDNPMMWGEDAVGFSAMRIKDGKVYILSNLDISGRSGFPMNLYIAPIDDPYSSWVAGSLPSIGAIHVRMKFRSSQAGDA